MASENSIRKISDDQKVCNIKIRGNTSPYKNFLKELGATNNNSAIWSIEKSINRKYFLDTLIDNKIPIEINHIEGNGFNGYIWLEFEYDEEMHRTLSKDNGCKCTDSKTCKFCKIAFCEKEASDQKRGFSGETFKCPAKIIKPS